MIEKTLQFIGIVDVRENGRDLIADLWLQIYVSTRVPDSGSEVFHTVVFLIKDLEVQSC